MDIRKATKAYEEWLGHRIEVIQADLKHKHAMMMKGVFPFFRATFYRRSPTERHRVSTHPPRSGREPVLAADHHEQHLEALSRMNRVRHIRRHAHRATSGSLDRLPSHPNLGHSLQHVHERIEGG